MKENLRKREERRAEIAARNDNKQEQQRCSDKRENNESKN